MACHPWQLQLQPQRARPILRAHRSEARLADPLRSFLPGLPGSLRHAAGFVSLFSLRVLRLPPSCACARVGCSRACPPRSGDAHLPAAAHLPPDSIPSHLSQFLSGVLALSERVRRGTLPWLAALGQQARRRTRHACTPSSHLRSRPDSESMESLALNGLLDSDD